MKKIEMGKKYRAMRAGSSVVLTGSLRWVDGKKASRPVAWEADCGDVYYFDAYGNNDLFCLVEIPPYADIPIDTPGWARGSLDHGWRRRHFAGLAEDGRPMAWDDGTTSHTADGARETWDEFTTTKPEGVE